MRARADARGYVELRGPTWWLKRWVTAVDPETGEIRSERDRVRLGDRSEIRTRAAARAAADEWIERTRPEAISPGPRVLAVAYLAHFQKIYLPLMRPTSRSVYRSIIRKHIKPAVAGKRLTELDTAWVAKLISARATTLHRATLLNLRRVALQILRQAVKDKFGACRIDTRDVRIPRIAKTAKPQRYFKAEQIEQILAESFEPWRTLWACLAYAGLRAGEGLALRWEDIDFEHRLITVRQNAVRGQIGAPKTATSQADVPLLPELEQVLRDYHDHLMRSVALVTPGFASGRLVGLLFQTRAGTPYQSDDVRRRQLHPVLKALGIPSAGLHAFRHSLPRILHGRGVSVKVISKIMRHHSITQTEVYLHSDTDDVWANLNKAGIGEAA